VFENLDGVERRFNELEDALASGSLKAADMTRMTKERASLEELVSTFQAFKSLKRQLDEARELLSAESDADMRALAK
jgi:peptide chain release factor 1